MTKKYELTSNLVAFRVPQKVEHIMLEAMKRKKLNKTEFMIAAVIEYSGYDYIPAKMIRRKGDD
jgi:hypothetical protein